MMIFRLRVAVVLAGVLGLLAAGAAQASAAVPEKAPAVTASRVELLKTGGYAGVHELSVAFRYQAGRQDLFAVVDSAEFRALRAAYPPKSACCDFFEYELTVWYSDHSVKNIVTQDTADAPDVLWKAIRLAEAKPVASIG